LLEFGIKLICLFFLFTNLNAKDFLNIHSTRNKTNLIKTESLKGKYFIFYQDSTFFDKRYQTKIFNAASKSNELEFHLTPKLFTFQEELVTKRFKDNLIIAAWIDFRNDSEGDVYAQLIDENGILWDSGGIPICVEKKKQRNIKICINEAGEIFFAWEDFRSDLEGDIYVQKIDLFGRSFWKQNGIVVSNLKGKQENPEITHDAEGGIYVAWREKLSSVGQIYVQRIDSNGIKKFGQYGIFISNPEEDCTDPKLIRLSNNDILIFYQSKKNVEKIYYQQITKKGARKFLHFGKFVPPQNANQVLSSFVRIHNDYAIIYLNSKDNTSILFQILKNGEETKFKNPIKIHSNCKIKQLPEITLLEDKFLIYWTCFHTSNEMLSLFIQEIDFKGNILKSDGINLLDVLFHPDTKVCLKYDKGYHLFLTRLVNEQYGIFYFSNELDSFGLVKIDEFVINYYDGHVKLSWKLLNERPGTKLFLEKRKKQSLWEVIYSYESKNRLALHNMNFDTEALENEDLEFRIRIIDPDGIEHITESKKLFINEVGEFYLFQNSPNPFKDSTKIAFKVPIKTEVKIKLYNSRLEEVGDIFVGTVNAGLNEIIFRPSAELENGIYFYRIITKNFYDVKKMILNR